MTSEFGTSDARREAPQIASRGLPSARILDECDRQHLLNRGYAIVEDVVDSAMVALMCEEIQRVHTDAGVRRRSGATYAIRNILERAPAVRDIMMSQPITSLVRSILGGEPRAVRSILFDKNPQANWRVMWHQDRTIAVCERFDVPGFGPWSVKAGVVHVQPPASVLEELVTIRLHLDDCDRDNGALMVVPASHRRGILSDAEISSVAEEEGVEVCEVPAGGVVMMRPLLLHASGAAREPRHRRVIHVEFAACPLPGRLEWADA